MVTAFVLTRVQVGRLREIIEALLALDGIAEVYSVAGEYDLVIIIRVRTNRDLARLVTEHMVHIEGILRTKTLVAFETHSRFDLPKLFGLEQERQ